MRLLLALLLLLAAAPARAADTPPPPDPTLLLNPAPLPVVRDGRLVNYIFVTLRVVCRQGSDMVRIRAKEPFFRDALVRAASRSSLAKDDGVHIDPVKLKAALLRDSAAIVGPGVVVNVIIVKEQPQKSYLRAQP